MAAFQMLVRALDGRTACLQFSSDTIVGCRLQEFISGHFGIPADFLRIVTGTREITPQICLQADDHGLFPSCNLLLRLRGGKGGFGSLLRGAATKAGQKKTSNFDACRDMSGRRLRHVNAEKKLKEWKAQAKERELEKTANAFLKKQSKRKEEDPASYEEIKKFMEETSSKREEVESAVMAGLAEAERLGKRRKVEALPTNSEQPYNWKAYVDIENGNEIIKEGHETKECNLANGEDDNGNKDSAKANDENVVTNEFMNEQLNFDDVHSAADMEVLGLLRLKCELQARGLKCGGSLEERAARLFLLKSTVLEKIDKKHFAKMKGEKIDKKHLAA